MPSAEVLFVWHCGVEANAWLPPYCITCVIFTVYMCIGCVCMSVTADIKRPAHPTVDSILIIYKRHASMGALQGSKIEV